MNSVGFDRVSIVSASTVPASPGSGSSSAARVEVKVSDGRVFEFERMAGGVGIHINTNGVRAYQGTYPMWKLEKALTAKVDELSFLPIGMVSIAHAKLNATSNVGTGYPGSDSFG